MTTRLATATQNAMADAVAARADSGTGAATIKVYTGGQPASANSAVTGTLLATFTCDDPAFDPSAGGVIDLVTVPLASTGVANGTAGWFRLAASDGATVLDGAAGIAASGAELILNTATISIGVDVEVTSGTITQPSGE